MHYDDDRAGPDTENQHYGNDLSEHLRDTRRSIRPGIAVPHTVLLTELDNGSLILQGRPNGPRAYLSPAKAIPLRRELVAAFRRTEMGPRDDLDDVR